MRWRSTHIKHALEDVLVLKRNTAGAREQHQEHQEEANLSKPGPDLRHLLQSLELVPCQQRLERLPFAVR